MMIDLQTAGPSCCPFIYSYLALKSQSAPSISCAVCPRSFVSSSTNMALPLSWTAGFTRAVDNVLHDSDLVGDATLHSRARHTLKLFDESGPVELCRRLKWAERIHEATPRRPIFTTRKLFDAMYQTADELSLVAGKRYVSAAICTCADHVANAGGTSEGQATLLAEVLSQLSTIWAAFVLWPFYARGHIRDAEPAHDSGDSTPTAQSVIASRAREQHRLWTNQGMPRSWLGAITCAPYPDLTSTPYATSPPCHPMRGSWTSWQYPSSSVSC
ncbi:hypothetical protein LXA43DRAFT_74284 [Ganoderma leucocontextum]|nr:hypothetical protein LXA43DRAFT_74284 [Ganoderma leucocontextum]